MDLEPLNVKISIGSKVEMLKKNSQLGFFLWPLLRKNNQDLQERRGRCRLRSPQLPQVARSEDDGRLAQTANRAAFCAFNSTKKGPAADERAGSGAFDCTKEGPAAVDRAGSCAFYCTKDGTCRSHTARVQCF